ncbi:MAG: hypothetical protein IPO09_09060 [Anaeromyxobacter sp.]|nr:hypothetical protein [Anaeromyxobacter sp.]
MDATFTKRLERLKTLKLEQAGQVERLAAARAAAEVARTTVEGAKINEVVEGTPAAAKAATDSAAALEKALEARDALESRSAALASGIALLSADLAKASGAEKAAVQAAEVERLRSKLAASAPVIEAALIEAACLWMLRQSGPLDEERVGAALFRATGITWQTLRVQVNATYDRIRLAGGEAAALVDEVARGG